MRFRQQMLLVIAGVLLTISTLLCAQWILSKRLLLATDQAYQQGLALSQSINTAREAQVNFQRQVQEWKNVLIRGQDSALKQKYWSAFQAREADMRRLLQDLHTQYETLGLRPQQQHIQELLRAHQTLGQQYRQALQPYPSIDAHAQQQIDQAVRGIDRATSKGVDTLVLALEQQVQQRFVHEANRVQEDTHTFFALMVGISIMLTLSLIGIFLWAIKGMLSKLGADPEHAVAATARIATGDLSERLQVHSPHSLIGALDMMQLRLRNIYLAIQAVSHDLKTRVIDLPIGHERDAVQQDIERLQVAINRIKLERQEHV